MPLKMFDIEYFSESILSRFKSEIFYEKKSILKYLEHIFHLAVTRIKQDLSEPGF